MSMFSLFNRLDSMADQLSPDAKEVISKSDARTLYDLGFMEASADDINEMATFLLSIEEGEVVRIDRM